MATKKSKAAAAPKVRRAVIVDGMRTPFVRAFAEYTKLDSIALANIAVKGLVNKTQLDTTQIDQVVWGGVILPAGSPNIARELVLDLKLGYDIDGFTVTRACASGLQAVTSAVSAIERGDADVIIAGGSDSTSNAEVTLPKKVVHALAPYAFGKAIKPTDAMQILAQLMPISEIIPKMPKVAERTTGEVMGQSAERMAKRNNITREAQDELTFRSHQRAAAAVESGRFAGEITPVEYAPGKWVHADTIVRANTSIEALAKLRPAFDRENGTLTAGNSTALTDGAASVLIMSEEKAIELGYTPLAVVKSWDYCAVDPRDQLLMGPAISIPRSLQKAGLTMETVDLVDIHEAFAAQVLSVLAMLDSDAFAQERLGLKEKIGLPSIDKLNVHGGSLALGHPFGATGARMVTTMANELHLTGKNTAVLGICAAGGIGAAAVLERA